MGLHRGLIVVRTSVTLPFADGEYDFALPIGQINELQHRCGAGIGEIYARVLKGRVTKLTPIGHIAVAEPLLAEYRIEDVVNVIRQGLIGGGRGMADGDEFEVTPIRAGQLVDNYVLAEGRPIKDSWALAVAILQARIEGYEPPEPKPAADKKKELKAGDTAGSTTKRRSRTARR